MTSIVQSFDLGRSQRVKPWHAVSYEWRKRQKPEGGILWDRVGSFIRKQPLKLLVGKT